jgi:hypothetical protein
MGKTKNITTFFANIYPFYFQKMEKRGRSKAGPDTIVCWLMRHVQFWLKYF